MVSSPGSLLTVLRPVSAVPSGLPVNETLRTRRSQRIPCYNEHPSCDYWASDGDCSQGPWQEWMLKYCPFSCGLCSEEGLGSSRQTCKLGLTIFYPETSCRCGVEGVRQHKRILGGHEVEYAGKYPWMAALLKTKDDRLIADGLVVGLPGDQFCGGTLVASKYVISAAHCMFHHCQSCQESICLQCRHHLKKKQPKEFQVKGEDYFSGN